MTVEVALLLSIISVVCSVFFAFKNSKNADNKNLETRTAEYTRLEVKIDSIISTMDDIKSDLKNQRNELNGLSLKLVSVEESVKQAHKRIDELVKRS